MSSSARPARHHYVPQFILRRFADDATGKVGSFDKTTRRFSYVGVRTAAQGADFNKDSLGDETVERLLGREVETPAAAVVKKLVEGQSPTELQQDEVVALRRLMVVQLVRGTRQRRVNTSMTRSSADLIELGGLEFDVHGDLTQDSQLRVVRSLLRGWHLLGCARWNLQLLSVSGDDDDGILVPDQGIVVFHPDLAVQGWTDASIDEMSCLYMPISPRYVLVLVNPSFQRPIAVPDLRQALGLVYGQADQFIYGRMSDTTRDYLQAMVLPETPGEEAAIP